MNRTTALRARSRIALALCSLLPAFPCAAWTPAAKLGYQMDSENLISAWDAQAGAEGIKGALGTFDVTAGYARNGLAANRFGLREFSTDIFGLQGAYRAMLGRYGFGARAGLSSLEDWKDYSVGGDASRYWVPMDGLVLRAKGLAESRVDKENPFHAALAMRTLTTLGSVNMSWDSWYVEAAAGARDIDAASDGAVDALLEDTAVVPGIPANRILTGYLYGYRSLLDFLTVGGFASWSDSHRDFYRFLHRSPPRVDNYMYFPYDTPLDSYAAGAILGVDFDWDKGEVPIGIWSAKVTVPFYSRRVQSYQARSPNSIPMWEGSYVFNGSEPWSGEIKVKKAIGEKTRLTLAYRFFLKPYLEYGFFDNQSYRMHALEIRIGG
ncbi:MAG: hypothetical protein JWP91_1031 [Fibrobacteres bacterium]|nr:hypothetical protein [Fibrobacterota bacterium]